MKKAILIILILLFQESSIYSSDITLEAVRQVNGNSGSSDYCMDSKPTSDGGTVAAGYSSDGLSSFATLIKYDISGNIIWLKTYRNNINGVDFYSKIYVDSSGIIYAVGGASNVSTSRDVLIHKYSPDGSILRTTFINSSANGYDTPVDFKRCNDGMFIVLFNEHESNSRINAAKVDQNGNIIWQYRLSDTVSYGSFADVDELNNVYITGSIASQFFSFNKILIKLNSNGNVKWIKAGLNLTNIQKQYYTLKVIGNNEIYTTDYVNKNFLTYPVLQKSDSSGNIIWTKHLKLNMIGMIYTRSLENDTAGNIYFINTIKPAVIQSINDYTPGYLLGKYSPDGDSIWSRLVYNWDIYSGEDAYFKINERNEIYLFCFVRDLKLSTKLIKYSSDGDSITSGDFYPSGRYGGIRSLNLDNSGNPVASGYLSVKYNEYDFSIKRYNGNCQTVWESLFDSKGFSTDYGCMIAEDNNKNIFISGTNHKEAYIIKYNSMLKEQWKYIFNDSSGYDPVYNMIPLTATDNGGFVYLGTNVRGIATGYDIKILKLNDIGNLVDSFSIIGKDNSTDLLKCMSTDKDDNLYLGGNKGVGSGVLSFVSKFSKQGTLVWDAVFGFGGYTSKLIESEGEVFAAIENHAAKISKFGEIKWVTTYQPNNHVHFFYDCALDSRKNIICCGYGVFPIESENFIVVKYDSSGNLLWERTYNGTRSEDDFAKSIAVDSNDNIYVAGKAQEYPNNFINCITLLKYDSSGTLIWKKILSDPDIINLGVGKVKTDKFGNVYVSTGYEYSNSRDYSYMMVKYKSNGDSVWSTVYNHPDFFNYAYDFHLTNENNIIMTGKAYGINTGYDITTLKYSQTSEIVTYSNEIPGKFYLYQNYPNPFNPSTIIRFDLPENNFVSIKIYDILGRRVMNLVSEFKTAGSYSVNFDGSSIASGIYIYILESGNFRDTKRMMLIK